jgi:hypothetical protein
VTCSSSISTITSSVHEFKSTITTFNLVAGLLFVRFHKSLTKVTSTLYSQTSLGAVVFQTYIHSFALSTSSIISSLSIALTLSNHFVALTSILILASGSKSHDGLILIELNSGLSALTVILISLDTHTSFSSAFNTTALITESPFSKSSIFSSNTQSLLLFVVFTSFQLIFILTL